MNYIRFFEILKTMKKNTCCTSMCKKYEATTLAKVTVHSSCDGISYISWFEIRTLLI